MSRGPSGGPAPVSAIVLAGGRSSRFGRDKLAAEVDGRPLLHLVIESMAAVADDIVIAGPDRRPWPAVGDATVRAVPDREPFGGPLQALAGGLVAARHDVAIVVAGDMPAIVPAVLEALLAELAADGARAAAVLGDPADMARRQPLPVALRVDAGRVAAEAALAAGDRSLVRLLDRLSVAVLPFDRWRALDPEARTLLDVDVPEDLARP